MLARFCTVEVDCLDNIISISSLLMHLLLIYLSCNSSKTILKHLVINLVSTNVVGL